MKPIMMILATIIVLTMNMIVIMRIMMCIIMFINVYIYISIGMHIDIYCHTFVCGVEHANQLTMCTKSPLCLR